MGQVLAAGNFARAGVVAGFTLAPQYTESVSTVTVTVGYDPDTGDPITDTYDVTTLVPSLTPHCTRGVLFAQGTMYRPGSDPAIPAAAAGQRSWLFYNSSTGFYWASTFAAGTAGDAFIGWVRTDATGIIASSTQAFGEHAGQVIPLVADAQLVGDGLNPPATFPDAPNVFGFTCAISYPASTDNYVASGTVTMPHVVAHLQVVHIRGAVSGQPEIEWAPLYGPFTADAVVNWTSPQLPRPGSDTTYGPVAYSENENATVTRPGKTAANVTVSHGAGTTGTTPEAPPDPPTLVVGYEVTASSVPVARLRFEDQLTETQIGVDVTLASGNTAAWVWARWRKVSTDDWAEAQRFDVGDPIRFWVLTPLGDTSTYQVDAWTGNASGGDNAASTAVPSATFTVHGLQRPRADGCTGGTMGAVLQVIDSAGLPDWVLKDLAIAMPRNDPYAYVVKLTFQCVDASLNVAPDDEGGREVEFIEWANDGSVKVCDVGREWGYNPRGSWYTWGLIRAYVGRRTGDGESTHWSSTTTHRQQTGWFTGGLDYAHFNFGAAPEGTLDLTYVKPSTMGRNVTPDASGRPSVLNPLNGELLADGEFDNGLAPLLWGSSGVTVVTDAAVAASPPNYLRFTNGGYIQQEIAAEPGDWLVMRVKVSIPAGATGAAIRFSYGYFAYGWVAIAGEFFGSTVVTSTGWTTVTAAVPAVVPAGTVHTLVLFQAFVSSGSVQVDSCSVRRKAEAAEIRTGFAIGADGSGNLVVKTGAGLGDDGSGNAAIKMGAGIQTDGSGNVTIKPSAYIDVDGSGNIIVKAGSLSADRLGAGSLGDLSKYSSTVRAVSAVFGLPSLPSTTYPQGSIIFNTSDSKLYRNTTGSAWSKGSDPQDLIAGTIAAGVAYLGTVNANQVNAGTFLGSTYVMAQGGTVATIGAFYDAAFAYYVGLKVAAGTGFAGLDSNLLKLSANSGNDVTTLSPGGLFISPSGGDVYQGIQLYSGVGHFGHGVQTLTSAYYNYPLVLGSYYLWVDGFGRLRIKGGAPTSDGDGAVVGSQS